MANGDEVERLVQEARHRRSLQQRFPGAQEHNDEIAAFRQRVIALLELDGDGNSVHGAQVLSLDYVWKVNVPVAWFIFRGRTCQLWFGTARQAPANEDATSLADNTEEMRNAWRLRLNGTVDTCDDVEPSYTTLRELNLDALLLALEECDAELTCGRREQELANDRHDPHTGDTRRAASSTHKTDSAASRRHRRLPE